MTSVTTLKLLPYTTDVIDNVETGTSKKVEPYTDYKSVGCYERVDKDKLRSKVESVFNELVTYMENL